MLFAEKHVTMDEAGSGDSAGGGAGGSTGSTSSASGASGGAGGSGATGSAAGGSASESPWHGLTAPEDVAYITNKGWNGPQDVIKSYRGAEKLIGKSPDALLELPRADDPEGFLNVMTRLGRPADAKDYKFDTPDDLPLDENYMAWFRGASHKFGLTAQQAHDLSKEHNDFVRSAVKQSQEDYQRNVAVEKQALLKEWGNGAERMLNTAQMAAKTLGFDEDVIGAIERTKGYGATMKMFAELGKAMSEDTFHSGEGNRGFSDTMTPAEAKAKWAQKQLDRNFTSALFDSNHPGHATAKKEQSELFAIMYPSN